MDLTGHARSSRVDPPVADERPEPGVTGLRRSAYLALGGIFFALAALGAVLPGLPTTPFLLLTSFFLVRSSPRLNAALLRSRWFGPVLRDWQAGRGLRRAAKIQAAILIVLFAGGAVALAGSFGPVQVATLGLGLVGITVVARLPESREGASGRGWLSDSERYSAGD